MKHRAYHPIWVFVLVIMVAACSGGGGGSGNGGVIYTGVTTQANLTTANANVIFSMMWNGGTSTGSVPLSPAVSKATSPGDRKGGGVVFMAKRLGERFTSGAVRFRAGANSDMRATPVSETYPGAVSGTLTMTGSIDETTLTGSITMTFTNFNDGDGLTIDGVVTMRVDGFDRTSGTITDATMSFSSWTMKSAVSDFTLGGSIHMQESVQARSETLTINMNGRDNIGNDSFKFENYVETTVYDNLFYPTSASETYNGRVYAGKYGYVDVSTVSPCIYMNPNSDPSSGGPIILAGAGSTRASVTPISSIYVNIEVDENGDGVYENKNAYDWNNLGGASADVSPVANAGPDQNVMTGSVVMLNGSGSRDVIGATLSYSWSFTSKPAGSTAALSSSTAINPTFTADKSGSYVLSLTVNNGLLNSAADTVTITAATTSPAPLANAGPDQNVVTGSVVMLFGSGSSGAIGATLSYSWSFTSKPAGSAATLSSATAMNPIFTADKSGTYVLSLTVNNGLLNSAADTVTITAATANSAPVANAGPDQNVVTGSVVTLDGSGSSGADIFVTLSYSWSFTSKPAGSTATLSSSTAVNPTFIADIRGSYVLNLVVGNGTLISNADSVTITATSALLVIDQEQPVFDLSIGGVGIGGVSQEKLAQVVTAGASGMLTEVRFPVACALGDLLVEIQGVTGGIPNGVVLASETIPGASLPAFYPTPGVVSFRNIVFTTPASISAGSQFAVILNSAGECGVFQGPVGDSYSGGNAFFDARPNAAGVWVCMCDFLGSRNDLPFQTLVEPAN